MLKPSRFLNFPRQIRGKNSVEKCIEAKIKNPEQKFQIQTNNFLQILHQETKTFSKRKCKE